MRSVKRNPKAPGFSLVEVMIALGILAIALPMIGTAFLSGSVENKEAVEDTYMVMMTENAMSTIQLRVTHSALTALPGVATAPTLIPKNVVLPSDLFWAPYGEKSSYGCVILAKQMATGKNDYRLVALAFRRSSDYAENDAGVTASVNIPSTGPDKNKVVMTDAINTYVKVNGVPQALLGCYVVRTSLKP